MPQPLSSSPPLAFSSSGTRVADRSWHGSVLVGVLGLAVVSLTACGSRLSGQALSVAEGGMDQQPSGVPARPVGSSPTADSPMIQGGLPSGAGVPATAVRTSGPTVASSGSTPPTTEAAAPSGPVPPMAGTYDYAQSGSTTVGSSTTPVPQRGTIVIDPAVSGGPGISHQTWHSYVDTNQPPTDTTYRFTPSGIAITSEVIRQSADGQSVTFTCTFATPLQVVPWPIRIGYSFSGTGDCTSFTVTVTGQITSSRQVSVDGEDITVYVIALTASTSGGLTSSDSETQWFAPSLRLLVHDDTNESGNYGPFSFKSDVTRDLLSSHPG
jgi:hypothetical protein